MTLGLSHWNVNFTGLCQQRELANMSTLLWIHASSTVNQVEQIADLWVIGPVWGSCTNEQPTELVFGVTYLSPYRPLHSQRLVASSQGKPAL